MPSQKSVEFQKAKNKPVAFQQDEPEPLNFTIVPENIKQEYVQISAQIAREAEKLAEASGHAARAKMNRERVYSLLYLGVCEEADSLREKKPSDTMIKAKIAVDPAYIEAVTAYIKAEEFKGRCSAHTEGYRSKKDMLISLGAHVRAELASESYAHDAETVDDEDDED